MPATAPLRHLKECRRRKCNTGEIPHATLRNSICIFEEKVLAKNTYAVGRKNFLFHDTVKGARSSAIIYSLVETAKLNKLNIYAYLETVLLYMPDYKNEAEGIEELMPWSEMIQQRCRIESKS